MKNTLIKDKLKASFGVIDQMYTFSGPISLIEEHTDYNDRFVLLGVINQIFCCIIEPTETEDSIIAYVFSGVNTFLT